MFDAESRWRRVTEWVIAREGILSEDARDLAQDVAIGYIKQRGIEPWNDPLPQMALLRCLIRNVVTGYHRHRAREREGLQRLCAHLCSVSQHNVEQFAVEHLTFNELLGQMSPAMREIVGLMLQGYTFREIAELLGIPQGTVKARFYRGAEELRQKVSERCNQTAVPGDFIIGMKHKPEGSVRDKRQTSAGESNPRSKRDGTGGSSLCRRCRRKSHGGGSVGGAISRGGCGCGELVDMLTALPMFVRLDTAQTVGVKVPGIPVVVPLGVMPECPGSYTFRRSQPQILWYPGWDCDGNTGNRDNLEQTRHKCYWRYTVNGQERFWVACSQWRDVGCTSDPVQYPLCATESNEKLCADTTGICQTQ
ncbi:MAG: RNA polymerase sigma factor [Armatimonadota bacterium]